MPGQGFGGTGTINDFVSCQGTILAAAGGAINLNGGVSVTGTGNVDLGGGNLIVDSLSPASGITAGGLSANSEYIGFNGTGTFTQSGGTNHDDLYVGYDAGSNGTYSLSGTGLLSEQGSEYIGYFGTGSFTHSGGTNSISNSLYLGYNSGAVGSYNLSSSGPAFRLQRERRLLGQRQLYAVGRHEFGRLQSIDHQFVEFGQRTGQLRSQRAGLAGGRPE